MKYRYKVESLDISSAKAAISSMPNVGWEFEAIEPANRLDDTHAVLYAKAVFTVIATKPATAYDELMSVPLTEGQKELLRLFGELEEIT